MKLSIIIVNYKTPDLTLQCLDSIYAATVELMEVIVVDNASGDDSETRIKGRYPQVHWLQMGYNSGFARANNRGIEASVGAQVLLLNSDTINEGDAIFNCSERLASSEFIAAGVQLLHSDRSPQISGNFFMTGALNYMMTLPYLGSFIRWVGMGVGIKKTNIPEATHTVAVDWINGAFLMVKKSAIQKAGIMDPDFFLYSEETEWCSRLGKMGRLAIYGDLHVLHLEGGSSSSTFQSETRGYQRLYDKKGGQILLSHLVRVRKQLGLVWFLVHLAAHLFSALLAFFIILVKTLFLRPVRLEWKNWLGYARNVFLILQHLGWILPNRPHFYKVL